METYKQLIQHVLKNGSWRHSRNGRVISIFGWQGRYKMDPFPLLTLRKIYWKGVVGELLAFLRGYTNVNDFRKLGVNFWDPWANPKTGELGRIYGVQWREFSGNVDQLTNILNEAKKNPTSRRLLVSAWNPAELEKMALPPCHVLFQFYIDPPFISCQLYQRSGDVILGVPYNIASYSLLTYIFAKKLDLIPKEFVHTIGDAHIYEDHVKAAKIMLQLRNLPLPRLEVSKEVKTLSWNEIEHEHIKLLNYKYHNKVKNKLKVYV